MAKFDWASITKEDVKKAIELFEKENLPYPQPRSTFLIYNGKKYPAKHIRGMAYKMHYSMEISKEDYAGGKETVRFFEKLGFDVQYTHKSVNTHPYDIMKPEVVLKLLYAKELKEYNKKKYIIINKWKMVGEVFYNTKLSVVLKVRSMENYCAVILSSDNMNCCFQCSDSRTSQVVREENGKFGLDLSRMGGPETIWKNKEGMKASWRNNIEKLIDMM